MHIQTWRLALSVPLDHVVSHFYYAYLLAINYAFCRIVVNGCFESQGISIMLVGCFCRLAAHCLSNMLDGVLGEIRKFSIAKGNQLCFHIN